MATRQDPEQRSKTKPPPLWLKRLLPLVLVVGAIAVWLSPNHAPRDAPSITCPTITLAQFESALAAGAVRGTVHVAADRSQSISFGPGVVSCGPLKTSAINPCKRPSDLAIAYTADGTAPFFVKVPAGSSYRFRIERAPNTCEILKP